MEKENKEDYTLIHISHLHPLHLTDIPPAVAAAPTCHACRLRCSGSIFECAPCRFALHPPCARLPKMLPHPSHPAHPLSLLLAPAYTDGGIGGGFFACDACRRGGVAFAFHCSHCSFDLHPACAALPESVHHPSHPHPVALTYEYPFPAGTHLVCDLCRNSCDPMQWFYVCIECQFGGHVGCFVPTSPAKEFYQQTGPVQKDAAAAAAEADQAAVLLRQQQQQLMNAISTANMMSANANNFLKSAMMGGTMPGSTVLRDMSETNLEINFNKPGSEHTRREREKFYAQRRTYLN
ncbi:uncharacterized protein LOC109707844 [Ananas comosus]|uniref:Uncharacterized protein LOC109707844 n=1 Tax=Ananas comosus TaxID=4615 RepID=A0A6P5EUZ0_ANACO|nr:uncharacterized protein LOC109707844 [Ananas comosus]